MFDENAEIIALQAVAFVISNDDLRDRFVSLSGMDETAIKTAISDRMFLISILEFLINHEPDLIAFAEDENMSPESVTKAWRVLGGGTGQEW